MTARPVAVPPSPKSQRKVAAGSGSLALKDTGTPASTIHELLSPLKTAPETEKRFEGGGGPPTRIAIDFVAVLVTPPPDAVTFTV